MQKALAHKLNSGAMVVLENELIQVEIDPSLPVMKHKWLKEPSADEFKKQLIDIKELYLQHKAQYDGLKWLADTKLLGQRSYEEEQWLEETWERLLFDEAGVKVHAVLLGDDIFADYSMEKFKALAAKRYEEVGVKLGVFLIEANAMKWLREN